MMKKLMKHLVNNLGLKVLSVLIAVTLWLVVVNYDNPEVSKTYTIPITTTNETVLEEMGKVYEVVGQNNMATIYVKGKRSYLDKLSSSDFVATADLSQIDFQNTMNEKLVPINVSAKRYEKHLAITQKTVNMKVTLEDLSEEQFYISCDTEGEPAEGYAIGEIEVSPNLIKISGPQSMVSKVERVAASVNVNKLTDDITVNVSPVLYDEEGKVIESKQLRLSLDKVTVDVQIMGTKQVPVRCETSGTPAEGYRFVALEYAPETVVVKGEMMQLKHLHEIVIPGTEIDLEGATGDVENSIDILPYLEQTGVSLVNPNETKIAVKAVVEKLETKVIEIPVEKIKVQNLSEERDITYEVTEVRIPIRGRSVELEELDANQIQTSLDLSNLSIGKHEVELEVVLDEKFEVMATLTLEIHIIDKEEQTEDSETENNAENMNENDVENETENEELR